MLLALPHSAGQFRPQLPEIPIELVYLAPRLIAPTALAPVYMSPSAMRSRGGASPGEPTIAMMPLFASAINLSFISHAYESEFPTSTLAICFYGSIKSI